MGARLGMWAAVAGAIALLAIACTNDPEPMPKTCPTFCEVVCAPPGYLGGYRTEDCTLSAKREQTQCCKEDERARCGNRPCSPGAMCSIKTNDLVICAAPGSTPMPEERKCGTIWCLDAGVCVDAAKSVCRAPE
jgi:hypothetical protein